MHVCLSVHTCLSDRALSLGNDGAMKKYAKAGEAEAKHPPSRENRSKGGTEREEWTAWASYTEFKPTLDNA